MSAILNFKEYAKKDGNLTNEFPSLLRIFKRTAGGIAAT